MKFNIALKFLLFLPLISCVNLSWAQDDEVTTIDTAFVKSEINRLLLVYSDSGNVDVVKYLLDNGANLNDTSDDGVTALMYASQAGSYSIVKMLLERGADPNMIPFDGNTALHAAVRIGNDSIAELLIKNRAKVNCANNLGLTPLHYAVWYGYPYLTDLLIYYGANVNAQDALGCTPLFLSTYNGTNTSTKLLLENSANPNLSDKYGVTPLMLAAQFNDTLLSKLLIEHGADINLVDKRGVNALAYSIKNNSVDVMRLLLDNGASNAKLTKSYYQLAKETDNKNILPILETYGLKTKVKPVLGDVFFGTGTIFNSHEFLWGFRLGGTEQVSKISTSLGYWYRPWPVAVLKYANNQIFQYKEKRQIVELNFNHITKLKKYHSDSYFGVYYGGNLNLVFRNYSGTSIDPKTKVYPGLNFGLILGGKVTSLSGGWEFTMLETPGASQHRIGIHLTFNIPVSKPRIVNKSIFHVN